MKLSAEPQNLICPLPHVTRAPQTEKDTLRETLARERKEHELFVARTVQREHFAERAAQEERERNAALGPL